MTENQRNRDSAPDIRHVIVGLGEVLWDIFPDGPRFGGAPANFACSISGLSRANTVVHLVSSVGNDTLGRKALSSLATHRVVTDCVQIQERVTGQVVVTLDSDGSASYRFADNAAWDHLSWNEELHELATRTEAVCYGTLGQRCAPSRSTIRQFLASTEPESWRIFDINLRPPFYDDSVILDSLQFANVLKLNDDELPVVARLLDISGDPVKILRAIARQFALRAIALTRGAKGAILIRGDELSEHPGIDIEVVDTVGAGDAYTAALTLGLLAGHNLDAINCHACEVSAFLCSQSGGTPQIPDRFFIGNSTRN